MIHDPHAVKKSHRVAEPEGGVSPAKPATPPRNGTSPTSQLKPQLRDRGVTFEVYDMPGVDWDNGVAALPGMGKAAWFKDSEGNILCLDDGYPELD